MGWSIHPEGLKAKGELPRVLVLGAGMSGLVAARILRDTGFPVKVIEARRRIGGRIWTDASLGVPCDLGASWIHGARNNPLSRWCKSLGTETCKVPKGPVHFWNSGRYYLLSQMLWGGRKGAMKGVLVCLRAKVLARNTDRGQGQTKDLSIHETLAPLFNDRGLNERDKVLLRWFQGLAEAINGSPAREVSIREWDFLEYLGANEVPLGGFATLVQDAARGLDVELDAPVREVIHGDSGVRVVTDKGVLSGDIAVITLPLGVIRSRAVAFEPPLDPEKQKAMERIGYGGVLNKIAFLFQRKFWPKGHERLTIVPKDAGSENSFGYWADFTRSAGVPLLVGFITGDRAKDLDRKSSDQEIWDGALGALREMFGRPVPAPKGALLTRWLSDTWAMGSYSYGTPGCKEKDRIELARPAKDRLYFAGEATHERHYGTVHGALLSGEREAIRIHARYCCQNISLHRLPWR